jgi:hypothetical protein
VKGLGRIFRSVPRPILVFGALHVLVGLFFLVSLALSHCVDQPCPPGMYCLDGCSIVSTPWSRGTWPYYLAITLAIIASSILILRTQRFARCALLLAVTAFVAYTFFESLVMAKDALERDLTPGSQLGWSAAWAELLTYLSPFWWVWPTSWVAFDSWFLFWHSRKYFRRVV